MPLHVYNTLSRAKEEFKPLQPGRVGIYVCGPTVYGHPHIGHAKSYVSFDAIIRYFRYLEYKVLYVQNITDVGHLTDDADEGEDKIEQRSKIDKVHPMQIAEEYTQSYFEDMDAMGVLRADIYPRATGHIIEQIQMVEELLRNGFAYEVDGSVYFDVRKFGEYGKLSGRVLDEMVAGTRVDKRSDKRHPADFALWKKAEPGHIMRWISPWGEGYPGWHIECSAMSMKYLGQQFDIHGGGMDNQFPHHECEIAQSECATGKPFVKYWLHNNLVTVNGHKMGKSLGNFITLKDAFKKYDPLVLRFFILQSHYRSTLDYSDQAVQGAQTGYEKLINTVRNLRDELTTHPPAERNTDVSSAVNSLKAKFLSAMNDDFNTPQAIAVLFDGVKEVNQLLGGDVKKAFPELNAFDAFFDNCAGEILGILPDKLDAQALEGGSLEPTLVELLLRVRDAARTEKAFALSDKIRDGLSQLGIIVEDRKDGTRWRKS
ncbi:MAG: cysteine--tRNA ligase [Ignavibacteria bacterium]|nr:cysteine--tRNA ligase [Ignavibacteria bacterium]